jgi:hypothetical protein
LRLGDELGSGAVASVHRVEGASEGRVFAGKILHERHQRDPTAAARFAREAELARRLDHPNLVGVFGVVDVEGCQVLLMELVEGRTLAQRIAERAPMDEKELVDFARGIANGLWVAHTSGVIHRDLKPANILLDEHEHGVVPKIADFGMARATSFAGVDRGALTVLGTPDYMAPECLDPMAVDPRADLYALGCIIHEMATGTPPYGGATPFAILEAHRSAEIPDLPDTYSPALRALTRRLLAKQPGDRPQSASAVVDALAAIERGAGDTSTAMVRARPQVDMVAAVQGKCARCGNPLVARAGTCFHCGLPLIRLEPGPMTVFVVGPGGVGEKLASGARDRLLAWVRANPGLGLDPTPLEHEIPRVPFVFAAGISHASAEALARSLGQLGMEADTRVGGRFAHGAMLQKSALLGGRRSAIVAAIGFAPALLYLPFGFVSLMALTPVISIVFGVTAKRAATPAMRVLPPTHEPLPPKIAARLERLADVVPRLSEHRHREALRAIVQRVITLVEALPSEHRAEVDGEMDHALNLAMVATTRMDELDRLIAQPEFDDTDPAQREDLRERDMWAGRVLDLSATLDALAARQAAARARRAGEDVADALESLRVNVEALEEVRRG